MKEIIVFCFLFLISALAFIMSFRSFKNKGFLFNNAYIYASKKERESMDKKPHYRQSAIVFLLIGFIFLFNALAVLFSADWMYIIVGALVIATIVYTIVSSVKIENGKKK